MHQVSMYHNYNSTLLPTSTTGPPTKSPTFVDSGASSHFFISTASVTNIQPTTNPITVALADTNHITHSTHTADLDLPMLRPEARRGHIVPSLTHSLLAVATFCNAGYTVEFDRHEVRICDQGITVMTGHRHPPTGLWQLDIAQRPNPPPTIQLANRIGSPTEADLVAFAHATLFSPVLTTLENALRRGFLTGFPGLTVQALQRHPPQSVATAKGHLDQVRKNLRSTKQPATIQPDIDDPVLEPDELFPQPISQRSHACFVKIFDPIEATGQIFSDQTGRFPAPSASGNNYVMILYDYDSNSILAHAFRNRTASCILQAFKVLHQRLVRAGLRPQLHRLDNECSTILKDYLKDNAIDYQLVPPGMHRRNAAERAIRTFQNHFIAGLCTTDPDFPIALWDELLEQGEISLNLLRGSRINPNLSAFAQINGQFDFNRTPLGPPGCRVVAHVKPDQRQTWAPHGLDGWYIGPARESYRCYRIWIAETRATRICDTVAWFPKTVTKPASSSNDIILASLRDITNALRRPSPRSPIAPTTDSLKAALESLTEILTNIVNPEPTPPALAPAPDPAPLLRVPTAPTDPAPLLRVPTTADATNEPLHIVPLDDHATTVPANAAPTGSPALIPHDVPEPPAPAPPDPPTPRRSNVSRPQQPPLEPVVHPPAAPIPTQTYHDITGPHVTAAKRRKRRQRSKQQQSKPKGRSTQRSKRSITKGPQATRRSNRQPKPSRKIRETAFATRHDPIESVDGDVYIKWDLFQHLCCHGTAINPDTGQVAELQELLNSSDGPLWSDANDEEVGRMLQGLGPDSTVPEGTETLEFVDLHDIPKGKKATYVRIVCADRPEKPQPRRVRWTLGGDQIVYLGNKSTKTADLVTAKILFNSVLSTVGAKFMTIDLKDFYLGTTLPEPEYVRIPVSVISEKLIKMYNLEGKIRNGYLYAKVKKGMYGLPHAGKLANDDLTQFLKPFGYVPCDVTPGLWKDLNSDLMFSLVVDDFGVRYTNKADVDRLLAALQQKYKTSVDWTGSRYVGLTLKWDYENGILEISMPGYVRRALELLGYSIPAKHEYSPHPWTAPNYGSRQQYATYDDSPLLDSKGQALIRQVVGIFLYYGRALDNTMLPALGTLASQQAAPTELTMTACNQFLDYAASNPECIIRFYASDMQLCIESDASYLSESHARSRVAGWHFLSTHPSKLPAGTEPPQNGPISVPCKILRNVLASAAEAELAGLFINGQAAIPERITLEELGHPQLASPMVTDNKTATGIANDSIKQKRSKAMDMRFFWIRDQVRQGNFGVYWKKGKNNRSDYHTKHHDRKHHRIMRPFYVHTPESNRFAPLPFSD